MKVLDLGQDKIVGVLQLAGGLTAVQILCGVAGSFATDVGRWGTFDQNQSSAGSGDFFLNEKNDMCMRVIQRWSLTGRHKNTTQIQTQ